MNKPAISIHRRQFLAGLPALSMIAAHAADEQPLENIIFGSCLDTHEHPMLDRTLPPPRDLFIFMGNNIHAHKVGVPMMQEKKKKTAYGREITTR